MTIASLSVRFVGSGRAQVDFNHRLAGKTLEYHVEVVNKVDTDQDKTRSLIKRRLPGDVGEKVQFNQDGGEVTVEVPDGIFLLEGLQVIKRGIANDIEHFIPTAEKVTFKEVYPRRAPATSATPATPPTPASPAAVEEAKTTAEEPAKAPAEAAEGPAAKEQS